MRQRLFEMVWLLSEKGGATAAELAGRFGVSVRTIYRDVDALSGAGVPVYAEPGKGGGIRLLPGFVLDKAVLSKQERAQLAAHLHTLDSLGTPDTDAVLAKLGALFGSTDAWLQVDFAPWAGGDETRALFRLLRDAILAREVVDFIYAGADGTTTRRTAEPRRVLFRGQGWYLYAFCRTRGAFRTFKLNRMQAARSTGEPFDVAANPTPATPGPYTGELVHIRLELAPRLAHRALDEFAPHQLEKTGDGGYIAEADLPAGGWLAGYLLSLGPGARVLAPAELREEMKALLAQMAAAYEE